MNRGARHERYGTWAAEDDVQLQGLWSEKKLDAEISRIMKWSPSQIRQRRVELGLASHRPYSRGAVAERPQRTRVAVGTVQRIAKARLRMEFSLPKAPTRGKEPPPLPGARLVCLTALGDADCRWPHGDPKDPGFAYCGLPAVLNQPYCAEHQLLAWAPAYARREAGRAA